MQIHMVYLIVFQNQFEAILNQKENDETAPDVLSDSLCFGSEYLWVVEMCKGYPDRCELACGCPIYSIDSAYIKAHDKEYYDRNHDSERNLLSNLTWPEDCCIPFRVKCRNPDVWGWTDWTYIMENKRVNWNLLTKDIRIMDRKCATKTGRWSNVKENGDLEGMHYTCVTPVFDETTDLNRH